jgi:hypothetical protein
VVIGEWSPLTNLIPLLHKDKAEKCHGRSTGTETKSSTLSFTSLPLFYSSNSLPSSVADTFDSAFAAASACIISSAAWAVMFLVLKVVRHLAQVLVTLTRVLLLPSLRILCSTSTDLSHLGHHSMFIPSWY